MYRHHQRSCATSSSPTSSHFFKSLKDPDSATAKGLRDVELLAGFLKAPGNAFETIADMIFHKDEEVDRKKNFSTVLDRILLQPTLGVSAVLEIAARVTELSNSPVFQLEMTDLFIQSIKAARHIVHWNRLPQASFPKFFLFMDFAIQQFPTELAFVSNACRQVAPLLIGDSLRRLVHGSGSAEYRRLWKVLFNLDVGSSPSELPRANMDAELFQRHNNDNANIACIRLLPTAAELRSFCTIDPLRPKEPINLRYDHFPQLRDRHFRLLRDEVVASCVDEIESRRRRVYEDAAVDCQSATVDKNTGMISVCVHFHFPRGHRIHQMASKKERREFVLRARRMLADQTLVALCEDVPNGNGVHLCERVLIVGTIDCRSDEDRERMLLAKDPCIRLLCSATEFWQLQTPRKLVMVGTTVTSFGLLPILGALQRMSSAPFERVLLQCKPPAELPARNPLSTFSDLFPATSAAANAAAPPPPEVQQATQPNLEERFDHSQRQAITSALANDVTLIQGPPGTGKTTVGVEICTQNFARKKKILLLCYTNHALDQFLVRVSKCPGVQASALARLGSQAKHVEVLPFVRQFDSSSMPRLSKKDVAVLERARDNAVHAFELDLRCHPVRNAIVAVAPYLLLDEHTVKWWEKKLQDEKNNRWLPKDPKTRNSVMPTEFYIWNLLRSTLHMEQAPDPRIMDYQDSTKKERVLCLFRGPSEQRQAVVQEIQRTAEAEAAATDLVRHEAKLLALAEAREGMFAGAKAEQLRSAMLVACTTTFASKNQALLRSLCIDVVMVEEAAEIIEAHILASIPPSAKQLVLIGDHKQLRPTLKSHRLSITSNNGFNLDRSLFERLVESGVPYEKLGVQHRMFTSLSAVVRRLSYPELGDAEAIKDQPPRSFPGLERQLQFIHHEFKQSSCDDDESIGHSNQQEAAFVAETVRYLLLQNTTVHPHNIVVLTGYLGQVKLLNDELNRVNVKVMMNNRTKKDLQNMVVAVNANGDIVSEEEEEGDSSDDGSDKKIQEAKAKQQQELERMCVRVSTIDNFQGEEADYVIASLVRTDRPGWMKERQRVTVLLSRAKKGMLLFGNRDVLQRAPGGAWAEVFNDPICAIDCSKTLQLVCRSHKTTRAVSSGKELALAAPDGGCHIPCERRMPCGHECPLKCHFHDPGHNLLAKKCVESVDMVCAAGHYFLVPCNQRADVAQNSNEFCDTCKALRQLERSAERELRKIRERYEQTNRDYEKAKAELEKETEVALEELQLQLQERQQRIEVEIAGAEAAALFGDDDARRELAAVVDEIHQRIAALRADADAKRREIEEADRLAAEASARQEAAEQQQARQQILRLNNENADFDRRRPLPAERARVVHDRLQLAIAKNEEEMNLHAERLKVLQANAANDTQPCCICGTDVSIKEIRVCTAKHVFCSDCFQNLVTSHCDKDLPTRAKHDGLICCPGADDKGCQARFTVRFVCLFSTEEVSKKFLLSRDEAKESITFDIARKQFAEEAERQNREGVNKHFQHIVEEVINMKCPRCKAVFVSFEGCFALTCHACNCGFCAWCLEDCGNDAHAHVAGKHQALGGVFPAGGFKTFENHHRGRIERAIDAYIRGQQLTDQQQEALRARVKPLL